MRRVRKALAAAALFVMGCVPVLAQVGPDQGPPGTKNAFRYYRLGNTGVLGDWSEALWIGPDGNPWVGGYDPVFEEGGVAHFVAAEDRWDAVSNVDYRIIGHPAEVGTARVRDITGDRRGSLWFVSWTALFRMSLTGGPSTLVRYDLDGAGTLGGGRDVAIAPDGTVWVAAEGAIAQVNPLTRKVVRWNGGFERVAVQPRPVGGYYVWAAMNAPTLDAPVWRYDSTTGAWEDMPRTGAPGEIAALRGTDAVDELGNLWAIHSDRQFDPVLTLGYRAPDGSWVDVPAPNEGGANFINSLKAFGRANALLGDATGRVWHWDGRSWSDLGIGGPTNAALGIVGLGMDPATGVVWTSGDGGAARRDPQSGTWQRYRITNCSQGDNFTLDISLTPGGELWSTANIGSGVGGFQHFDGVKWRGFNALNHGLPGSGPFPFNSDATFSIAYRPSSGHVALGMPSGGVQEWTGSGYVDTGLPDFMTPTRLLEDSRGRLWAGTDETMFGVLEDGTWTFFEGALAGGSPARDPQRAGWVWLAGFDGAVWTDGATIESVPLGENGRGIAPAGNGRAWVGGSGLYLVDMNTRTSTYYGPDVTHTTNPRPVAVAPDGILWYGCDEGLCWLDTNNPSRRRGGTFHAPPGGEPQWGGLPWWPQRAELHVTDTGYELWMTTPSRGITVLDVKPAN